MYYKFTDIILYKGCSTNQVDDNTMTILWEIQRENEKSFFGSSFIERVNLVCHWITSRASLNTYDSKKRNVFDCQACLISCIIK